ncbi:flagellar biosynthesis protein FlhB [Lactiplantibacillus pentosus]|uniref:Flagellar biosynthesis protein FlhB n=2 Tax=Lactiplantibacillus pentosus TaxID=1589 RepID=A0AAW8VZA9_LACPE|nr:flagellar biosynthesis protein FlhB [Lactiplantibacillus pentosus]AUI79306.1 flagellar biosynthesis protein FlhB [Lactiplantibacillus pentosus]MBU7473306.1 flagellar biosynthesis protein FlhB [Lactiplantibacillus pentosus]MBU7528565.1 flagellar biosynthesis protein FlhB [Lactiplantibacillus pentosus]MCA1341567.1 flagellar biosynthesis protein FlhB [Lactiplantibacillus pentosus]MCE6029478.1 flagellar biosynthesis protein FlhB [Lactiplantibacillus pentosus]
MDQFPNFKLFIDKYLPWLAVIGFVVTVSANGNVWLYFMAVLIVFVVVAIIDLLFKYWNLAKILGIMIVLLVLGLWLNR